QNAAKTRMIDHLSHELKTPLAVMSASSGLLQKWAARQEPERARAAAERVQRAIGRLVELQLEASDIAGLRAVREEVLLGTLLRRCQDVLECVVEEQGGPVSLRERVTRRIAELYGDDDDLVARTILLDAWVPATLEALRDAYAHRRLQVGVAVEAAPGVRLPESVLFKAVRGLFRNAVEATPDGGAVDVVVRTADDGSVSLEVRDTGVGMDAALREQLFLGFVHAGATNDYSSGRPYDFGAGGKGLDLQRIKLFSERYGFGLSFTSEVGEGSVFTLAFPPALLAPRDGETTTGT
ncbi:MAG: HAMP domain-containing histidine kinase, partial [Dehalococcoidia bacterium]|nr:HAMP domain-containing histidine kinase [Dehalococcoidia bacterium]